MEVKAEARMQVPETIKMDLTMYLFHREILICSTILDIVVSQAKILQRNSLIKVQKVNRVTLIHLITIIHQVFSKK